MDQTKQEGFRLLPIQTLSSFNSDYPNRIRQDGSFWQGKGVNLFLDAGVILQISDLELRFQPGFWVAQNLVYDYRVGETAFGDYGWGLDRLQRYGPETYWEMELGQSEIRYSQWGMTIGLGTRNLVLGPALFQNLLVSSEASGFPLLDFGTDGRLETKWGIFDARVFWGQTRSSTFYDGIPANDLRFITGAGLAYSPPMLKEMTFGFIRLFHSPWQTINGWKVFQFFVDTIWKNDRAEFSGGPGLEDDVDQVLSVTWEWKLPLYGARVYAEVSRNDHSSVMLDFLMQPDHSLGWVVGMEQKFSVFEQSGFSFILELADVGNNIGTIVRPTGSWYRHNVTSGGYTQGGQALGAPMGPGSNFQTMQLGYEQEKYWVKIGLERLNYDADFFYAISDLNTQPFMKYNLSMSWKLSSGFKMENWEFAGDLKFTQNWNHNFIPGDFRSNFYLALTTKYVFM